MLSIVTRRNFFIEVTCSSNIPPLLFNILVLLDALPVVKASELTKDAGARSEAALGHP